MAGTQIPTWLGVAGLVVGTPLILMDAAGANEELNALGTPEARQEACMRNTAEVGAAIPYSDREDLCSCVVAEANARGAGERFGGYNESMLNEILELCWQTTVVQ